MPSPCTNATRSRKSSHYRTTTPSRNFAAVTTVKHTHEIAERLQNEQARPVKIQGTFNQAVDPHFPTFLSKCMTIAERIQARDERAGLHTLTEPNKVMYAKHAMSTQNDHLHDVKPTTTWTEFKQLVTEIFERRHAQHDFLRAIQDLRMHGHDLRGRRKVTNLPSDYKCLFATIPTITNQVQT